MVSWVTHMVLSWFPHRFPNVWAYLRKKGADSLKHASMNVFYNFVLKYNLSVSNAFDGFWF